ncbi:DNA polymerase III subunit chi [Chitinilyticum piscinae]|uniref:DNA polymerase III subunit chi n=1 Tax=Chitinilyticum piscinae TaxID=2866724 RepID=A0A8J7FK64_9NEIS|nr:DNA polymerase III subunit chi [Chitinilyticum piscinae]MBE9609117.1 DNA polymerase III subunit chi [Chitinilyticum piscinae]
MSDVDLSFYFNVRSRETALCQLAAKALAQGLRISVLAASEGDAHELDRLLWSIPQTGFLPHCAADDPRAAATPVIVDHRPALLPANPVVFNWTGAAITPPAGCTRLIEIVDQDDDERARARARWLDYKAAGVTPRAIDLQEQGRRG